MLKVFLVNVSRTLWGDVCFPARRVLGARSGAGVGRVVTRRLCSTDGRTNLSCTVDPNQEEQFVFVDCTGELGTSTTSISNRKTQAAEHVVLDPKRP